MGQTKSIMAHTIKIKTLVELNQKIGQNLNLFDEKTKLEYNSFFNEIPLYVNYNTNSCDKYNITCTYIGSISNDTMKFTSESLTY